jgi:general secretion pathway protein H
MTKKAGKGTRGTSATGERGFTLIELLVVMTILVLMAGLFPLALNRALPTRRVAAAAEQVWSALRYAQSLSTVSGRPVQVRLQGSQVLIDATSRVWNLSASASLRSELGEASRDALVFYADGTSDGATIELKSGARTRALRVSALTGRIVIEPT